MIPDPMSRTSTVLMLAQSFGWAFKQKEGDTFILHRGLRSTGELDAEGIERMDASAYASLAQYLVNPDVGLPGSDPAPSPKPDYFIHADRYDPIDLRILEAVERACEGIQAFGASQGQHSELYLYLQAQAAMQERILTAFSQEARALLGDLLTIVRETKAQNNLELRVAALEAKTRN